MTEVSDIISEKDFAATVDGLAALHGWKYFGVLEQKVYGRRTSKGFPDRVMVRGNRLLFVEYKSEHGRINPDQASWLEALYEVDHIEVYCWRPSDRDRIDAILS